MRSRYTVEFSKNKYNYDNKLFDSRVEFIFDKNKYRFKKKVMDYDGSYLTFKSI